MYVTFAHGADEPVEAALLEPFAAPTTDEGSAYYTFAGRRNATLQVADGPGGALVPLALDVVYTYVNGSALPRDLPVASERVRDWGELRYSLRTVYWRALCEPGPARGACVPSRLFRTVYIVVADEAQVPSYVNASHPRIRIVYHRDIGLTQRTANSNAIESALHRIAGLSRFFVYFNNDQFWGRRVSLFDYFRPLSRARAVPRLERAGLPTSRGADGRSTWVLEPIYYAERSFGNDECVASCRDSPDGAGEGWPSGPPLGSRFFRMLCPKTYGSALQFVTNFNKAAPFVRIPGYWPTHAFAHYIPVLDRRVLEHMEADFEDLVRATRQQRTRERTSLEWVYVSLVYALSQRLRVDWEAFVAAARFVAPPRGGAPSSLADLSPHYRGTNGMMQLEAFQFFPPSSRQAARAPLSRLQLKKLNDNFATFEHEDAAYYFCMGQTLFSLTQCETEIRQRGTATQSVFMVTVNDDLIGSRAWDVLNVARLLSQVFRAAGIGAELPSPWETHAQDLMPSLDEVVRSRRSRFNRRDEYFRYFSFPPPRVHRPPR